MKDIITIFREADIQKTREDTVRFFADEYGLDYDEALAKLLAHLKS